ncbi:putative polygalacturonase 2-3 [Coleophoma crateriformis]|uniref:endo-polygalacturonase n=1 Tax=Coleophoma crateriformis TaxID=565419 RepID=A0A3D8T259_9HELO|nr:putative polygalacturonase 2-3 [Coleophoma crateriformis]
MVSFSSAVALLATAGIALAAPAPLPTAAAKLEDRATTCTFTNAASVSKSKTSCATIVLDNIAVPSGTSLDLSGLTKGTHVIFEGTTSFGYEEWSGPLVKIGGTDITVTAASGAYLKGDGARWWDGKGSNGGKTKPNFFAIEKLISSTITGLYFQNSPRQVMSINDATTVTIADITIDNSAGNTGDTSTAATNTDAFDIASSTGVTITGANVSNQDDCLAINSGTDITFTKSTCTGGHGLSIGSVGGRTDNTVKSITISSSTVTNSQNAVRVKTNSGTTGTVSDVTYSDISFSGITKYGIVVEQDYLNGGATGTPTSGVPITGLTLSNVKGTVTSSGTNVYLLCASGACSSWKWTSVSATGGKTSTKCKNIPSGSGASC